jgi:hypothetical protein
MVLFGVFSRPQKADFRAREKAIRGLIWGLIFRAQMLQMAVGSRPAKG